MLSFPVVFVSSARESVNDFPRWKRGLFNLDREKNRISLFFMESPDFPLSGVGRSADTASHGT